MTNSKADPMYKYVDDKLKLIKGEIQQLKVAHDAVANQHAQALLELQRFVARLKINSDVGIFGSIIDHQLSENKNLFTQLVADGAATKAQLKTSNDPFSVVAQFLKKWSGILRNAGADLIEF